MAHPVWSGSITFGLVNIPVKLFNTTKNNTFRFHQLRKSDGCRVENRKVCPADGKEVSNENIVRGFEISPERYIAISSQELEALSPKAIRAIEIENFVPIKQIDPVYFEQSFYVVPAEGAGKSYFLLHKAMNNTKSAGIARFVFHTKEYLAVLRPIKRALGLSTMLFHNEIIQPDAVYGLSAETAKPSEQEVQLTIKLIEALSTDFDPEKYQDNYRQRVSELIDRKVKGEKIINPPATDEKKAKVIDITAALEASLAAAKKNGPKRKKPFQAKSPRNNTP